MPPSLATRVVNALRSRNLVSAGARVCVAVSGGADSVSLLRLLLEVRAELGLVLSVAHFNHHIRAEAAHDEAFVAELASESELDFYCDEADVPAIAREAKTSLETAAREARYRFFRALIASGKVNAVATAHTLDDQAETVLMRVLRGSGTTGLAGIHPKLAIDGGAIIRPLLDFRRFELEQYLREIGQSWREDATNSDLHHTRNRVRHVLLPLIEREFNPSVRESLATLAEVAREEETHWLGEIDSASGERIDLLLRRDVALARRVVRAMAERDGVVLDFREVVQVLELVGSGRAGTVELHDGWIAEYAWSSRTERALRFTRDAEMADYEFAVSTPADVSVPCGVTLRLRAERDIRVIVRNWREGDRFFARGSSGPKKVKELLSRKKVTGTARRNWPVVVVDGKPAWLRGFGVAADCADTLTVEELAPAATPGPISS